MLRSGVGEDLNCTTTGQEDCFVVFSVFSILALVYAIFSFKFHYAYAL